MGNTQSMYHDTDSKVVYRRYASLFFITGIGQGDNELITLEIIHRYVEVLDRYFGNVCFPSKFSNLQDFALIYSVPGLRTRLVIFLYNKSIHSQKLSAHYYLVRIFNFQKAYAILDELVIAGDLEESSKKAVLRSVSHKLSRSLSKSVQFSYLVQTLFSVRSHNQTR